MKQGGRSLLELFLLNNVAYIFLDWNRIIRYLLFPHCIKCILDTVCTYSPVLSWREVICPALSTHTCRTECSFIFIMIYHLLSFNLHRYPYSMLFCPFTQAFFCIFGHSLAAGQYGRRKHCPHWGFLAVQILLPSVMM